MRDREKNENLAALNTIYILSETSLIKTRKRQKRTLLSSLQQNLLNLNLQNRLFKKLMDNP